MFKIRSHVRNNRFEKMLSKVFDEHRMNDIATHYAELALKALKDATPKDTGLTAASWSYNIVRKDKKIAINFKNSNEQNGCNVAILLLYGHGTKNGGYVEGHDFISPSIDPILKEYAQKMWKEATE